MSDAQLVRGTYLAHLASFVELVFEIVQPLEIYFRNWPVDVCCYHLHRVLAGTTPRLSLNLPPRSLKSTMASIAFPVWAILRDPSLKIAILGGTQDLTSELQKNVMSLFTSEPLQGMFPDLRFERDGNELHFPEGGSILFVPYGLPLIGRGFDIIIIDDPNPPARTKKKRDRDVMNGFFETDVLPRLSRGGRIIIGQQRVHAADLTGHVSASDGTWQVIAIPAIATTDETWDTGLETIMRPRGEALCPSRESVADWQARFRSMSAADFAAQIQQQPLAGDNPSEVRGMMVWARPPDGWDPSSGFAASALVKVHHKDLIAQQVFGEVLPFVLYNPSQASLETWEQGAIIQQASLQRFSKGEISAEEHYAVVAAGSPNNVNFDSVAMERFRDDIVWAPIGTQSIILKT